MFLSITFLLQEMGDPIFANSETTQISNKVKVLDKSNFWEKCEKMLEALNLDFQKHLYHFTFSRFC